MPEDLGTPVGGSGKNLEEPAPSTPPGRGPDEVALDLMKFIAVTSGYGRSGGTAGFSGKPTARSAEEYADALLLLFERCRDVVKSAK